MSNKIKNKKEQMMASFVDTGANAATEWGNDFIKKNVPKSLDWITSHIKDLFSTVISQNNNSNRENIRKTILAGIEIGEENKERALVRAMIDEGINREKISLILEKSSQYLITREEIYKISKR